MPWHAHPTEIRFREADDTLHIEFSDDEAFDYDTHILRGYCPCAVCQGHGNRPLKWNPPQTHAAVVVDDVGQVGNYAICIAWGDGHNKGIYSFEFLREIVDHPAEIFDAYPPDDYQKPWE